MVQTYSKLGMCPKQLMKYQPAPNLILPRVMESSVRSQCPSSQGLEERSGGGWEGHGLLSMPRALPGLALFNHRFTAILLNSSEM